MTCQVSIARPVRFQEPDRSKTPPTLNFIETKIIFNIKIITIKLEKTKNSYKFALHKSCANKITNYARHCNLLVNNSLHAHQSVRL